MRQKIQRRLPGPAISIVGTSSSSYFSYSLASRNSLRDISTCLKAHIGASFTTSASVDTSTSPLSGANKRRDWRIFEDFGRYLIDLVRPMHADSSIPSRSRQRGLRLDSTTFSLSLALFRWASGKYSRGAISIHPLLNLGAVYPPLYR